jgi:hypothetical protein
MGILCCCKFAVFEHNSANLEIQLKQLGVSYERPHAIL